jgi:hypothetical protein
MPRKNDHSEPCTKTPGCAYGEGHLRKPCRVIITREEAMDAMDRIFRRHRDCLYEEDFVDEGILHTFIDGRH